MRAFLVLVLVVSGAVGCTPHIPAKDGFGTSALVTAGDTPPEYAAFNKYDAAVNNLLADQLCATPHQALEEKTIEATPGRIEQLISRCRPHVPLFGS